VYIKQRTENKKKRAEYTKQRKSQELTRLLISIVVYFILIAGHSFLEKIFPSISSATFSLCQEAASCPPCFTVVTPLSIITDHPPSCSQW